MISGIKEALFLLKNTDLSDDQQVLAVGYCLGFVLYELITGIAIKGKEEDLLNFITRAVRNTLRAGGTSNG